MRRQFGQRQRRLDTTGTCRAHTHTHTHANANANANANGCKLRHS
jgi:hypothetical protein